MRPDFLPYGLHEMTDDDVEAVAGTLRSGWITSGPAIAKFEREFTSYTGAKYAVAVNSGTAALDIAVGALGLTPGDEAITTPLTFVATANALLYHGLKPVFADIDPRTWNLDPVSVRRKITAKTRAIVAVDYSGQPCDLDDLRDLASKEKLTLIEDAAHALGARYKGKPIGSQADLTTFSFHPVKHITTGEGGMVTTNNEQWHKRLLLLRNHGINRDAAERYGPQAAWRYDMVALGRNYRITDFQCALGSAQLKRLEGFVDRRRQLVASYRSRLPKEIESISEMPDRISSWHIFPVLLPRNSNRDVVFEKMRRANIGVNVHYIPVYHHSYYQRHVVTDPKDYPITEDVFQRLLTLPLYPKMTDEDIQDVAEALRMALQ